jgi:hypothetical protein
MGPSILIPVGNRPEARPADTKEETRLLHAGDRLRRIEDTLVVQKGRRTCNTSCMRIQKQTQTA